MATGGQGEDFRAGHVGQATRPGQIRTSYVSPPYPYRFHLFHGTLEIWGGRGVTRIKPRSAADAHDRHLSVPNINTPWRATIKQLIHNI